MFLTQFFLPPNRFVLLFPSFQLNLLLSFHSGCFVHPINSPLVPFKCPALSKILNVMSSFVKCVSNVIEENHSTTSQLLCLWSYPFRMNRVKILVLGQLVQMRLSCCGNCRNESSPLWFICPICSGTLLSPKIQPWAIYHHPDHPTFCSAAHQLNPVAFELSLVPST